MECRSQQHAATSTVALFDFHTNMKAVQSSEDETLAPVHVESSNCTLCGKRYSETCNFCFGSSLVNCRVGHKSLDTSNEI
jgi:hypothetical protein